MALFMVANNLNESNFFEKAEALSFPSSVIGMMRGDLGQAPGGFPKALRELILKQDKSGSGKRKAIDLGRLKGEIEKKIQNKRSDPAVSEADVMSYVMHPQSALEFLKHRKDYGDTSVLPTVPFFYGMTPGEEISAEIEPGRTLYIKLIAVSESDGEGFRTLFFEVNGYPRDVKVRDRAGISLRDVVGVFLVNS
jgi:pyruvate carboxylase